MFIRQAALQPERKPLLFWRCRVTARTNLHQKQTPRLEIRGDRPNGT